MLKTIMPSIHTSRRFDTIFVLTLVVGLGLATVYRDVIADKLFFMTYTPSSQAVSIAADASLTPEGRRLFYRTDPQFVSQEDIETECDVERLGCLTEKGKAFILASPDAPNETLVTSAHEMLHLAYRRFSPDERAKLAPLIDEAIAMNKPAIEAQLEPQTSPADRQDEAHSLLGTEYRNLPEPLEEHYRAYFTSRENLLDAATGR